MSQSAAKNPPGISWKGSTLALSVSSQKTVRSDVLKYSCSTPATVDDITSELGTTPRRFNVFYEPNGVLKPCAPQITRPRSQVEHKSRKYLRHYGVGFGRQQRLLKTVNRYPYCQTRWSFIAFR